MTKRVLVNLNTPERIEKLRLVKAVLYIATPAQGADIADIGDGLDLIRSFAICRVSTSIAIFRTSRMNGRI